MVTHAVRARSVWGATGPPEDEVRRRYIEEGTRTTGYGSSTMLSSAETCRWRRCTGSISAMVVANGAAVDRRLGIAGGRGRQHPTRLTPTRSSTCCGSGVCKSSLGRLGTIEALEIASGRARVTRQVKAAEGGLLLAAALVRDTGT